MDSSRGRQKHSYRNYRPAPHYSHYHGNFNYTLPSTNGLFQVTGIQRQSLKWKKDHHYRGNHKSRAPYRKGDNARKSNKSEDVEEEERKKKLTDTANKLLNKIKTWSAGNDCAQVVSENTSVPDKETTDVENKPKRIAHSKKVKLVKKKTQKSNKQPAKKRKTYDVNKETVKDFQSRIQHKLMEEIMQMPKENLQNVLNDPKINPIMELKMSRLVRENRLLIAHKLRAIAESKMKSDCPSSPQFLADIDKLIDPVIESDLSVLPYELIKQMENIFQVQFDYSPNGENSQGEIGNCETAPDSETAAEEETSITETNIKLECSEDFSLYECSTDEDEEVCGNRSLDLNQEDNLNDSIGAFNGVLEVPERPAEVVTDEEIISSENPYVNEEKSPETVDVPVLESNFSFKTSPSVPEEPIHSLPEKQLASVSCQTECRINDSSTQTICNTAESLYGIPLPRETTDGSIPSLLEEVNAIQTLVNKLNERRWMIFLQLARSNPSGSFVEDAITRTNFIETVSNGNLHLVDALKQFFTRDRPVGYHTAKR